MRKKIVAGNWKMNKTPDEGILLTDEILVLLNQRQFNPHDETDIVLCPPFTHLKSIAELLFNFKLKSIDLKIGAQNCHWENQGAFTGEVAAQMVKACGAEFVIIGHSERRQYFNETNQILSKKVKIVLEHHLYPIFCCGESYEQRNGNKHFEIIESQLKEGMFHLNKSEIEKSVIAYEPVWAIGTGVNAKPEQAQQIHEFIRKLIERNYDIETANNISIIYGGSCNVSNAKSIFSQPDIDGGLIGGASLKAKDFVEIIFSLP